MSSGISRRALLQALPFGLAAQVKAPPQRKTKSLPAVGEFARIIDPATENTIVRLTSLASSNVLPMARNRFVSARDRTLVFASDRTGHFTPYQVDLHMGGIRQLADPANLNPRSLCFDKTEKLVRYLDSDSLFEVNVNHGSPRRIGGGYSAFSYAPDGSLFAISGDKLLYKENALAEAANELWPQPNSAGCLFARTTSQDESELYYVPVNGSGKPQLVAGGRVREAYWDVDGESILFLRDVTAPSGVLLAEIHGKSIHGGNEYVVSSTSQFACFAPNSDASVFVGASRSRAQPNVVLMLRTPHREMTLSEHHSSHPGAVSPVFSPDNRRIYFESDREGRSAIYAVNVELLVEPPS